MSFKQRLINWLFPETKDELKTIYPDVIILYKDDYYTIFNEQYINIIRDNLDLSYQKNVDLIKKIEEDIQAFKEAGLTAVFIYDNTKKRISSTSWENVIGFFNT